MQTALDILFLRVWWDYRTAADPLFADIYHYGNLLEGSAWLAMGVMVFVRYLRQRRSWIEIAYAAAFVAFGLSDFREAYRLESWLVLAKGINLVTLLCLRRRIVTDYYPSARLF